MKSRFYLLLAAALLPGLPCADAAGVSRTNRFAYGENIGWINYAPSNSQIEVHLSGTHGYLSGYAWAENIGWIKMGSGEGPYRNTTSNDWGVNLDIQERRLSGYAWSENAGWISFGGERHQVTIDLESGLLHGYAWGENIGWISMSGTSPDYGVALEVLPTAPLIVHPPSGVAMFGHQGGPFEPSEHLLRLSNASSNVLTWSASADASWLQLSAISGTLAGGDSTELMIRPSADASGLPPGEFSNVVTIVNEANGSSLDLFYTLSVVTGASLKVSPLMVRTTITETLNGIAVLTISNEDGAEEALSATLSSDAPWLTLSGSEVTDLPAGESVQFLMRLSTVGLRAPGVYTGAVTIASNDRYNNPKRVPVIMVVQGDELDIEPRIERVFRGHVGGPFSPTGIVYTLSNSGFASLTWGLGVMAPWLNVEPSSGTLAAGASSVISVAPASEASEAPPGVFTNRILVTNLTAGTVKPLPVILEVISGSDIHLVTPIVEARAVETLAATASVVISNRGGAEADLDAAIAGSAAWMTLGAESFSGLAPGATTSVVLYLDAAMLTSGVYVADLVVTHNDILQGPLTARVEFTVLADELAVQPAESAISRGRLGGPFVPERHIYMVTNEGPGRLDWSASSTSAWLNIAPASGSLEAGAIESVGLTFSSASSGLVEGVHSAQVLFGNLTQGTTHRREVTLHVYNGPYMMVTPLTIAAQAAVGSVVTNYLVVSNGALAGGALSAALSTTSSWVEVAPSEITNLAPGSAQIVTVTLSSAGFDAGLYEAAVDVVGNDILNPTATVSIALSLAEKTLVLTPSNAFAAVGFAGGPFTPPTAEYTLVNLFTGAVQWSASGSQEWLAVSPTGGVLEAGATGQVTLAINDAATSNLAASVYTDTVAILDLNYGWGANIPVSMTVTAGPRITVSPLILVATNAGSAPVSRTVTVSNHNLASANLNITIAAATNSASSLGVMAVEAQPYTGLIVRPGHDFTQTAKGAEFVPGELLVRFKNGAASVARASALAMVGATVVDSYEGLVDGLVRVEFDEKKGMTNALKALNADPAVLYAEPNYIVRISSEPIDPDDIMEALRVPNDPRYGELWGMPKINAPAAWDRAIGNRRIVVAVIDTGVDYTHPDLAANMWRNPGEIPSNGIDDDGNGWVDDIYGWDFINRDNDPMDDHNHGTHCAGTIGAVGNNGVGVAGVNWEVSIMALKFLSSSGSGSIADALNCVLYATKNKARLTSNSWGGGGYSQAFKDAIDAAGAQDIAFICAAGNSNNDNDRGDYYPANYPCPNLMAILATDINDQKASFSSYGRTKVHVGAPGVDILSTVRGGYAVYSGTSMATPHVAGAAALLLSANPRLTVAEYKQILMETSDKVLRGLCSSDGRINLNRALQQVRSSWLDVAPSQVNGIPPGGSTNLAVTMYSGGLEPGVYSGSINILSNDPRSPSNRVAVSLIVPDGLVITPSTLFESSGRKGGPFSATNAQYVLSNTATNPITWQAIVTQNWLTLSSTGGVLAAGRSTNIGITINQNAAALRVGRYKDELIIRRPATGIEDRREIILEVYVTPEISVSPLALHVTNRVGQIADRTITVGNAPFADGELSFTVEVIGPIGTSGVFALAEKVPWLAVTPASVTNMQAGISTNLKAAFDAGNMDPGVYFAEVLIDSTDRRTPRVAIPVRFTILPEALKAAPLADFRADGPEGGPFVPSSAVYRLTNEGDEPLHWTASHSADWLDVVPPDGAILPGGGADVTITLNEEASRLIAGTYTNALVFSNKVSGATIRLGLRLRVSPQPFLCFMLDADPRWRAEGQWAFGFPQGGGSGFKDPTAGRTGANVLGYNLAGNYENDMSVVRLTSTAIDCRQYKDIEVSYWRWLGVEGSQFDRAAFEVSHDGTNWVTVWTNGPVTIADNTWVEQRFNISSVADGRSTLYLRWSMGPTDDSVTYPGWNIDDICLYGIPTAQYMIVSSASAGGAITPHGTQTVAHGATLSFSIAPSNYYIITNVVVDGAPIGPTNAYAFSKITSGPRTIVAYFDALRTPNGVPLWWLAELGYSNNWAEAEQRDADGDGYANWQEWRAQTDARDPASLLRVDIGAANASSSAARIPLSFKSVEGMKYRVFAATSLDAVWAAWTSVPHAMSLTGPLVSEPIVGNGGEITVYIEATEGVLFELIAVE